MYVHLLMRLTYRSSMPRGWALAGHGEACQMLEGKKKKASMARL